MTHMISNVEKPSYSRGPSEDFLKHGLLEWRDLKEEVEETGQAEKGKVEDPPRYSHTAHWILEWSIHWNINRKV